MITFRNSNKLSHSKTYTSTRAQMKTCGDINTTWRNSLFEETLAAAAAPEPSDNASAPYLSVSAAIPGTQNQSRHSDKAIGRWRNMQNRNTVHKEHRGKQRREEARRELKWTDKNGRRRRGGALEERWRRCRDDEVMACRALRPVASILRPDIPARSFFMEYK